jgi:hypothetical protein
LLFRSDCTEGPESAEKADLQIPVEDVRVEWRLLWRDRIDDRVRAEGIANRDYSLLFVERGRVIVATRDFKPLNFKEILRLHRVENVERFVSPPPSVGGWGKFGRTVLNKQKHARKWKVKKSGPRRKRKKLQLKKGGRGWLHYRMQR